MGSANIMTDTIKIKEGQFTNNFRKNAEDAQWGILFYYLVFIIISVSKNISISKSNDRLF